MPSNFRRRQAARAALPLWLMLTMPVLFLALTFGVGLTIARQAARLHEALHPRVPPLFAPESAVTATQVVLVAASFLTGALLAMPLGNILLWLIPPPRGRYWRQTQRFPETPSGWQYGHSGGRGNTCWPGWRPSWRSASGPPGCPREECVRVRSRIPLGEHFGWPL